jgi:hypothetical protein
MPALIGHQLLCKLAADGIMVTLVPGERPGEDKLRAKPTAAITPAVLESLKANKASIVEALSKLDFSHSHRVANRVG